MSRGDEDEYDDEDVGGRNEDEGPEESPPGGAASPNRLLLPGILMIATGVVNLLLGLGGIMIGVTFANLPDADLKRAIEEQNPQQRAELEKHGIGPQELRNIYVYGGGGGGALWVVCAVLSVIGGACMCARKARGLAILSALVTAVPCVTSPCCLFGMPIGIWALVVLLQRQR
ncbi:MAG TPA: hypothetical protein VKA46_25155 [Gemmataceae bacterium]|nr:hypothetical protein [Gemmataceae bacterium]